VANTSDIEAMSLADLKGEYARLCDAYTGWTPKSDDPAYQRSYVAWLEQYSERLAAITRRALELRSHPPP
jgi:hypothetical protein